MLSAILLKVSRVKNRLPITSVYVNGVMVGTICKVGTANKPFTAMLPNGINASFTSKKDCINYLTTK